MTANHQPDRPTKLSCHQIWKLFGARAEQVFRDRAELDRAVGADQQMAVLRNIDLSIGVGEIFVVMGLSGSGKSTLLRCLARLIEPSFGEVVLDGVQLTSLSAAQLMEIRRHQMAMVFQSFALLPHLTVRENVALPLRVRGTAAAEADRLVTAAVNLVGLGEKASRLPHQLSGGQQQRVGLARALAGEPGLLFLDEPFSALDPLIRRELQDELLRLQAKLHKTMIFVTHDFNEAVRLGDRIAIMKDGAIVQTGTPEEVVLAPADDYVQSFVADVDRARVISCGRIATPVSAHAYDVAVGCREKVAQVAGRLADRLEPIGVLGDDGVLIGEIDAASVMRVLAAGGDRGARP